MLSSCSPLLALKVFNYSKDGINYQFFLSQSTLSFSLTIFYSFLMSFICSKIKLILIFLSYFYFFLFIYPPYLYVCKIYMLKTAFIYFILFFFSSINYLINYNYIWSCYNMHHALKIFIIKNNFVNIMVNNLTIFKFLFLICALNNLLH